MRNRKRARIGRPAGFLAVAALLGGCGGEAERQVSLEAGEVEFDRPPPSGEPYVSVGAGGRAILTWIEPEEGVPALRLAIRGEDGWSEPRTVWASKEMFVNWADFPSSVEMSDGTLAVHWLEKVADAPYAYHVMLALSSDDGMTWTEPFRAHDDDSPTEHGFVSMVPWGDGAGLTWLDARAMAGHAGGGEHVAGGGGGERGAMSVRFRTLAPDGHLGPEVLLDDRTCECCQTALARVGEGLVAAYRDRGESEVRDIAVVRGAGERWTEPAPLSTDGWVIPGCPVNGPQLSGDEEVLTSAWYTGVDGTPQVYAAFSNDGGATFGPRIRVDEGLPLGRVDIERLDDGSAVVVWLEASNNTPRVLARRVDPDGSLGTPLLISETAGERSSGFPRMVRTGDEFLFAWTIPGEGGGVRVRSVRLSD
ncbi:sialidase family protein [Candidatus Palauibacter soopunensis]|uniref:sialidase family protein n=1 Tax=Candidatus Palauibacter soopunensis TaxID=3056739 RepID=UPI00239CB461|nr:sialidase family protein [Candidatus Palauibacter soopunensis]MDE2879946.1 sialidase family protein [Candidatus Palauibacter soopunensis]